MTNKGEEVSSNELKTRKCISEFINTIICGDCAEIMKALPSNSVDLVITSPPYDLVDFQDGVLKTFPEKGLRDYEGYTWDFVSVAEQLYRITKPGGVVVWVVGDKTEGGSESGSSFRQALYFKELGFNVETMIYERMTPHPPNVRYWQEFEFMFVFSKGNAKTFNPLMQPKQPSSIARQKGNFYSHTRNKDGELQILSKAGHDRMHKASQETERIRSNIWQYKMGGGNIGDKLAHEHPAAFPEQLAKDHILSWSSPDDLVLDPFVGSGTVPKMCIETGRSYIGIDCSVEYVALSRKRIARARTPLFLI